MYRKVARGFTLVEVFIVIAVIGILAAIAIPVYANYSDRAKMAEALLWVSKCKLEVSEAVINSDPSSIVGKLSEICNEVDTDPSAVVRSTSVDLATGTIKVTVDHNDFATVDATTNQFWMRPMVNGEVLDTTNDAGEAITTWECGPSPDGNNPLPFSVLPNSCSSIL